MPGEGSSRWRPSYNPWLIAISVMLATFMEVIDTSIASVAIPHIAGSVSATNDEATWVLTSYLVANAVFLPTSNWFALKFGRKRYLMFSIVVFTVASFACGIAESLWFILLARAVQGAGGGGLQPLSQSILLESFPPEKRGQALGLFAVGVVVAPVLGPTLGGYLTDHFSWRWAFYINIPVGIVALLLQSKFLEDPPYIKKAKPGRLDGIGLGLLAIWTASLQLICDKGQEEDWFGSSLIRWATVLVVGGLLLFIWRELIVDKPLIDLCILRDRNLTLGCVLIFLFGLGVYSITSVLPLFFQTLMGYSATQAGFAVNPRGIGSFVSAGLIGYLSSKVDSRKLVVFGFALFGAMAYWTSSFTLDIGPNSLFWPITLSGFALPAVFVPLSGVAFGTLSQSQIGNASGIYNLLRNLGGSVGIAAANTIATRHWQSHRSDMIHYLNPASENYRHLLAGATAQMHRHTDVVDAGRRAILIANQLVDRQARVLAYADDFRYLSLICALCILVTFFLKKTKPGSGAGAA